MGLTIDDLKPKKFKVTLGGVGLDCSPLSVAQVLDLTRIGEIFQNPESHTSEDFKEADKKLKGIIGELIPELKDTGLEVKYVLELIEQLMDSIEPSDNQELKKAEVKFKKSDPKVQKTG